MRWWLVAALFLYSTQALAAIGAVAVQGNASGNLTPLAVTFQNTTGSNESAGYVTIGQAFKQSDVKISDSIVLDCGSGNIYTQMDVLATYRVADGGDGSVRHAALTAIVPAISANSSLNCNWKLGSASAPSPAAPSASTLSGGGSSYAATATFGNFYIPTPSVQWNGVSGSIPNGDYSLQATCVNASGESTPSNAFNATLPDSGLNGIQVIRPYCDDQGTLTGWNIYINGHLQGSTHSAATANFTLPSVSGSGAAPPSTNTAAIGSSDSAACKSILATAVSGGTVQNWLSGPAVNEFDVKGALASGGTGLIVRCHIRAYAGGATMTDIIFDDSRSCVSGACSPAALSFNYNISITGNYGGSAFTSSNIQQQVYTAWHHQVYTNGTAGVSNVEAGAPNVLFNYAYLRDAGAITDYDTSYGIDQSFVDNCGSGCGYSALPTPVPPMSTAQVTVGLGTSGGRRDISIHPAWSGQWLLSGQGITCANSVGTPSTCNTHARAVMMANADAGPTGLWWLRDESTDLPINASSYTAVNQITDVMNSPFEGSCGQNSPNFINANCFQGSSWEGMINDTNGIAHAGDYNYVPYLVTASHWQLMALQYQANAYIVGGRQFGFCKDYSNTYHLWMLNSSPQEHTCIDYAGQQARGQGWAIRTVGESAAFTPDNDSMKSYFNSIFSEMINGAYSDYVTQGQYQSYFGELYGFWNPGAIIQPYQQGYIMTALDLTRRMQINTTASTKLGGLQNWMSHFFIGVWNHGNPDGSIGSFPSLLSTTYNLQFCTGGLDFYKCENNGGTAPITTVATYYTDNVNGSYNGGSAVGVPPTPFIPSINGFSIPPMPIFACCGASQGQVAGPVGGYPNVQQAGLALLITYNGDPLEIGEWAFDAGRVQQAYNIAGVNLVTDYAASPQFINAPIMPDGTRLLQSGFQIADTASSPTKTASGSADNLLVAVDSTGTCTFNGGGTGPSVVMMNDAQNASGCAGVFNASAGQAAYMYGGWGVNNTFNTNTGNDYVWLPPSGGGTPTVAFDNTPSGTDQVANFRHGTTVVRVLHNVDGQSFTNDGTGGTGAAQFVAKCAVSGSDTLCTLGSNTIRFLGAVSGGVSTLTAADVTIH